MIPKTFLWVVDASRINKLIDVIKLKSAFCFKLENPKFSKNDGFKELSSITIGLYFKPKFEYLNYHSFILFIEAFVLMMKLNRSIKAIKKVSKILNEKGNENT